MSQPSTDYIFMSYSRKDNAVMQRIVKFLRDRGSKVWVDNERLIPGTPVWEKEIEKAVQNASAVIVVLSPDSKDSEWVRREISLADQYRKRVFPILVRGDDETSISLRLLNRQYVDVRENEAVGLGALETALSEYLSELMVQEQNIKIDSQKLTSVNAALKKAEYESAEKAKREVVEKVAREKAQREQAQQEIARKAVLEKAQRETAQKAKEKKSIVNSLRVALGGFGFLFVLGVFIIGTFLVIRWQRSLATPTPTEAPKETAVSAQKPIDFSVATDPPIVTDVPTEAPVLGIGSSMTGADGMTLLYVPAGEFTMGSDKGDPDEKPVHKVTLGAFWIDKTEVTNKMYSMCVDADTCKQPIHLGSFTNSRYYDNHEFDDYPVIYVDWNMAKTYCEWVGRSLPTESQWEKAARGLEANMYPWGNTFNGESVNFCDANCSYHWANKKYNDDYADVSPVGNYPSGRSVYGALDMAGNVWEWVDDWYDVYPNGTTTSSKFGQKYHVLRGGSWFDSMHDVRSADRYFVDLTDSFNYFSGFRCALNQ